MGHCLSAFSRSRSHDIPIFSSDHEDAHSPPRHRLQHLPKPQHQAPSRPPTQSNPPQYSFSKPSIPSSQIGSILDKPYVDIKSIYDLDKELGRGQFGITYLCTEKATGSKFACKSISRRKLVHEKDIEDVRREVMILQHLTGQPNIVEFKGAYEDKQNIYVVMELCSGGELFDRILARGSYTEREAASICRQIVNVVHACHFMGVMHRDLKPENFLLASRDEDAPIKATDFGLSVFIEPGKVYKEIVGSAYYVAPEVLRRNYGKEIDVWSAGVILYILLSGVPPFWAETEKGIFEAILDGNLDLQSSPWPSISASAKDLIRKMLTRDPKRRITAAGALEHRWLKDGEKPDKPIDSAVLKRLKQFSAMNKLKKLALKVIAENLSEEEIKGLKQMFNNMDTDGSGTITYEELKNGLSRLGSRLNEAEIKQLMDAADVDQNGSIDYTEFITATMHRHKLEKEEHLYKAFQYFDIDNSGFITREDLRQVMTQYGMGDETTIDEIIEDVDTNKLFKPLPLKQAVTAASLATMFGSLISSNTRWSWTGNQQRRQEASTNRVEREETDDVKAAAAKLSLNSWISSHIDGIRRAKYSLWPRHCHRLTGHVVCKFRLNICSSRDSAQIGQRHQWIACCCKGLVLMNSHCPTLMMSHLLIVASNVCQNSSTKFHQDHQHNQTHLTKPSLPSSQIGRILEKETELKFACKSISRRKLVHEKDIEDVRREVMILQHLTGQPNIVEFRGAYEGKQKIHIVMELCSGGELFDRILARGSYSEREAASICRQIVNVVHASLHGCDA
ncbi:hypothetical protein EZV62_021164 [Acer yangbiense]|uniref:non-specific serine/threonine protein kinase n=1 Tax=Acer yangbiense TaxID=1000413 RepID=A0A5C7H5Z4_9ROSI|nr:hypothetical protein EZV62_021164 [Acer yangbiense]